MLEEIQDSMFQRAKAERDSRMKQAFDFDGMPRTHARPASRQQLNARTHI
jgi:hypothetical protein